MASPPASSPAATGSKSKGGGMTIKHYILAALTSILAVSVLVTAFFIMLSPARIQFSIAEASSQPLTSSADASITISLTLIADNPSRRATVKYQSLFVDMKNSTGPEWVNVNFMRANVTSPPAKMMPLIQPTRSQARITAAVLLVGSGSFAQEFTRNMTSSFTVMITTAVRFKVGFARTRLYDVKVTCKPLKFLTTHGRNTNTTTAAAVLPVRLPLSCE